jgi:hypothetical protein
MFLHVHPTKVKQLTGQTSGMAFKAEKAANPLNFRRLSGEIPNAGAVGASRLVDHPRGELPDAHSIPVVAEFFAALQAHHIRSVTVADR